ncbi:cytochrome P450 [Lentinula aff. lateritia]|uniref:Cytochrome P450 n=1 Tax=Lentinula aff. lateritia TaxID=2804960 RepID=A0ACC1UD25_9AGAR|nr:cytochrome P450 [Lentinula aff. lateritia]
MFPTADSVSPNSIPTSLLVGIGLIIITIAAIYQLILYPFYLSPLRALPGPALGPNLLMGRFGDILNGEAGVPQREWVKNYGKAIRVVGPIGIQRVIFSSAESLQKILVTDWISNPRPGFMRDTLGLVAGYGLLTVTGDRHKQMRKAMNPAFSIPNLTAQTDMYYDAIDKYANSLQITYSLSSEYISASWGQGSVEIMYEWMSKVTLDIICLTGLGYEADSLRNPHNELAQAYEELISLQTGRNLARLIAILSIPGMPAFLGSRLAWRHRKLIAKIPLLSRAAILVDAMHRIKAVSASILREKMKEAEHLGNNEDTAAKKDIMSLLVRARMADQKSHQSVGGGMGPAPYTMSDTEMMDQVLTFLGAGHETTASGLAWTLWLLAKDPVSQQRLRDEITPYLQASSDGLWKVRLGYRELKDLVWLDCVIQESLRLYPPVPMTFRQAATTDHVDGVLIPKGTLYYIPIRVVNTLKDIWGEDAEEFNPLRWLPGNNFGQVPSTLTFLAGPHACIGKTMAIMEMKAVIAALIANFEFSPSYQGQKAIPTAAVTMKPKHGMPLLVNKVVK